MNAVPNLPRSDSGRDAAAEPLSRAVTRILHNETLFVTLMLVLSLGAVLALAVFLRFDDGLGLAVFRILVITIFTILPAVMYYVFIASRKSSLFQEFVSNLGRLGLLQYRGVGEADGTARGAADCYLDRMRILSYIDRFEAVYGPVGGRAKRELLDATGCSVPSDAERALSDPSGARLFSPATAVPVFVATFLIGLGWVQFIPPWAGVEPAEPAANVSLHAALLYNELPALFAFLGAYFFSLQMLYRRYVTNDLRASAFVSVSIRIVLGVIGAWLLQVLASANAVGLDEGAHWLLFASFVVGAFPPVLWRIVRETSSRVLVLGNIVPSLDSDLPLNELDGLTIWHQTRLEEEDIENAHNMANADIIALLVNTRIPPERIVDWVDQAILYSCLERDPEGADNARGDARARLANLGIGTASTLRAVFRELDGDARGETSLADALHGAEIGPLVAGVERFTNLTLIEHWRAQHLRPDDGRDRTPPDRAPVPVEAPVSDSAPVPPSSALTPTATPIPTSTPTSTSTSTSTSTPPRQGNGTDRARADSTAS